MGWLQSVPEDIDVGGTILDKSIGFSGCCCSEGGGGRTGLFFDPPFRSVNEINIAEWKIKQKSKKYF